MNNPNPAGESAELQELRAQVRALQSEIAQVRSSSSGRRVTARDEARQVREDRQRRSEEREISDKLRDILDRSDAEGSRVLRAIVVGYLENVQLWAAELDDFTRRVNERNRPTSDDTADDVTRRLGREVTSEFLETIRRSFDFPQQTLDRIRDSFEETENLRHETKWREPKVERERTDYVAPDGSAAAVVETTKAES